MTIKFPFVVIHCSCNLIRKERNHKGLIIVRGFPAKLLKIVSESDCHQSSCAFGVHAANFTASGLIILLTWTRSYRQLFRKILRRRLLREKSERKLYFCVDWINLILQLYLPRLLMSFRCDEKFKARKFILEKLRRFSWIMLGCVWSTGPFSFQGKVCWLSSHFCRLAFLMEGDRGDCPYIELRKLEIIVMKFE